MKRICLCLEIHISHILPHQKTYTRNGENNNDHIIHEEKTVKKVASENLLPFFQFIQKINSFSDEKITVGISVSGIALTLLQKYAPEVITRLSALKKSNYIEFFSETWSHSAVACFNPHSFRRQIQLHDRLMKSFFGEVPRILFIHSPNYPNDLLDHVSLTGKRAVFMNSNHLDQETFQKYASADTNSDDQLLVIPVNYALSQLIQDLDFNLLQHKIPYFASRIIQQFKNHAYENYPAIVNCNLTREKCFFHLSRSVTWEEVIRRILNDNEIGFISPSEMLEKKNHCGLNKDNISDILLHSKKNDVWLNNVYQKKTFEKQLAIDALLRSQTKNSLLKEWDHFQDMEYLYFMNDKFATKQYAINHFNPFPDPYAAHKTYMETLNNSSDKIQSGAPFKKEISGDKLKV